MTKQTLPVVLWHVLGDRGVGERDAPVLDLHGFSVDDALHELRRFLELYRSAARRTVRVITGKGRRSPAGPVLRERVDELLSKSDAVERHRDGLLHEGGDGVFVVTIRGPRRALRRG